MQIGYARVSTDDQDTAVQVAALKSASCERIYKEKASGDAAREEGGSVVAARSSPISSKSEIRKMITKGDKTAADAARLFKVHPATVSRLLARPSSRKVSHPK